MHPVLLSFKIPGLGWPVVLPTYGFFLALGFVLAIQLGHVWAMRKGYDLDFMGNFYLVLILSSIAGSRAVYVWLEWDMFATRPWEAFLIWRGGLVFYGGVVGGAIGCVLYVLWCRGNVWAMSDLVAPCLALGHLLGRTGCFLNGCCYGNPTDLPWGMAFPYTARDLTPRHPTQLYEIAGLIVIFIVLCRLFWKPHRDGAIAMTYLSLYAPLRYVVELYRGDDRGGVFLGLSISQLISVSLVVGAVIGWAIVLTRRPAKET